MATDVTKWFRVEWSVKLSVIGFCIALVAACASSPDPQAIVPPVNKDPSLAQITIKREFRLLGGGNTHYIFNVFDFGEGIHYNSEVPVGRQYPTPYLTRIGVISGEYFETVDWVFVTGNVVDGEITEFKRIDPRTHHEHLVERFDDSLLGTPLLSRIDPTGGSRIGASDSALLPRSGIHVVKLRQLYDVSERRLYRVVERTDEVCYGDYAGMRARQLRETVNAIAPAFRSRPDDFVYAEWCGFHVDRDLHWNAQLVEELKGYEQGTWYRPAGRMALYATLGGGQGAHAEEIYVEAGKQYVGMYDPYTPSFVIQDVE